MVVHNFCVSGFKFRSVVHQEKKSFLKKQYETNAVMEKTPVIPENISYVAYY